MHQRHKRERGQICSLGGRDLARARKCKLNSEKSELGKKARLLFRADRRENGPLCSFQEKGLASCTSWVKEGHALTNQGRDKQVPIILKNKVIINCFPIMQKESP